LDKKRFVNDWQLDITTALEGARNSQEKGDRGKGEGAKGGEE
jgi:hypothetical protein